MKKVENYFTKEQFKFVKDVFEKAFLSDSHKYLCSVCPDFARLCKCIFCDKVKNILDGIVNNWDINN